METTDILIYETGSGGEMDIQNNDLAFAETLYQQAYIALFGGNVESNTKTNVLFSEERFDYWANSLLWQDDTVKQFNSNTERVLNTTALNSSGRLTILRAVEQDLDYMRAIVNLSIEVELPETDKVRIIVTFTGKTNQQDKVLQLVYDNAKNEIIIEKII